MSDENILKLLQGFTDGIEKAAGAASCMIHQHGDPRFIPLRDRLVGVQKKSIDMAVKLSGVTVRNAQ